MQICYTDPDPAWIRPQNEYEYHVCFVYPDGTIQDCSQTIPKGLRTCFNMDYLFSENTPHSIFYANNEDGIMCVYEIKKGENPEEVYCSNGATTLDHLNFFNLDVNSVCFCTPEMLERYKKIVILKEYIEQTEQKVQQYNQQQGIDDSVPVNGIHQTNLGVFRAYLELYLKNLPVVNSDLTYMVRQLQPTEKGIPLEVYFFSREKDWVPYEKIQADVFDHIFAVVPYFGLKVFQNPSSADIVRVLERV